MTNPPRIVPDDIPGEEFQPFAEMLRQARDKSPKATALVIGKVRLDYAGLCDRVAYTAGALRRLGLKQGGTVASLGEPSAPYVIAYCAVVSNGSAMVPLPALVSDGALARMIADCDAQILLVSEQMRGRLDKILTNHPDLAVLPCAGMDFADEHWPALDELGQEVGPIIDWPEINPNDVFNIIYSSGTTGVPKGIVHSQLFRSRQLMRMREFGIDESVTMLVSTAMYSNTTLVPVLATLGNGGTLVMMGKFDAGEWLALAAQERATHTMIVPAQVQRLLTHDDFDSAVFPSLSHTIVTSAPFAPEVKRRTLAMWPGTVYEMYGLTEGGLTSSLNMRQHPDKLATVGRPSALADLRIVGPDLRDVPQGEVGEVLGRSPTMMLGYHKRDDLTEEALARLDNGKTYMRTGDLGRFDEDGFLHIVGRAKDVIVSGGFNIYAIDLEDALLALPGVLDAAVIGVPSEKWGETPLGLVVPLEGATLDPELLRAGANERLGRLQRLSEVRIVEQLPKNALGKVIKAELKRSL